MLNGNAAVSHLNLEPILSLASLLASRVSLLHKKSILVARCELISITDLNFTDNTSATIFYIPTRVLS